MSSEKAGYGKSTKIIKFAREKGCTRQHYLSLSGVMHVPQDDPQGEPECEKFLWDQF